MTHFGALAAAASGRSPFVAVYPQSTVADSKTCPWYAAWATARVPHPSAIAGGVTAPDRPSPTGKHHYMVRDTVVPQTECETLLTPKPTAGHDPEQVLPSSHPHRLLT
jgi:hypothetical protein